MKYTVSMFRRNIRKALNQVDTGGVVHIVRYDTTYKLVGAKTPKVAKTGGSMISDMSDLIEEDRKKPVDPQYKPIKTPTEGENKNTGVGVAKVIKTPKDAETVLDQFKTFSKGVCKIHGIPLDSRGKCLQKGCKFA